MRLLVLGANGQIGWELSRSLLPLGDVIALDRRQCDLSRPEQLPSVIRSITPNVIINAAGYTAVDKAEQEERLATTVNGIAVGILAEEARNINGLLIHFSTDYVFDGSKDSPYNENDPPCPINAYGRSKLAGEHATIEAGGHYLIFRTSWIYAARGKNFLKTALTLAREQNALRIVADQVGAPTWARNIADATMLITWQAIQEQKRGNFVSGLFNMTASGATSWYEFAETILNERVFSCTMLRNGPKIHPVSSSDFPRPAARPKNSRLTNARLYERFGIMLPDWKRALVSCMRDMDITATK